MMTTEELDALDALSKTPKVASVEGVVRVLDALPRLHAEAREAATLRAKLIEVETQQSALRHDMNELRDAAIEFVAAASVPTTTFAHARLQAAIEESR